MTFACGGLRTARSGALQRWRSLSGAARARAACARARPGWVAFRELRADTGGSFRGPVQLADRSPTPLSCGWPLRLRACEAIQHAPHTLRPVHGSRPRNGPAGVRARPCWGRMIFLCSAAPCRARLSGFAAIRNGSGQSGRPSFGTKKKPDGQKRHPQSCIGLGGRRGRGAERGGSR